jgi:CHAT domain-containing protein/predicted negative regulator of RcsB-dependent stress response
VLLALFFAASSEPGVNASPRGNNGDGPQHLIAEADALSDEWVEGSLRQALAKYDQASRMLVGSGDLRDAAIVLMKAGEVSVSLGEYRQALERYRRAITAANAGRAHLEAAEALSETGRVYSLLGNNQDAQPAVVAALEFFSSSPQQNQSNEFATGHARALGNFAEVQYSRGNLLKASENFTQALNLFAQVGNKVGQAKAHRFLAYIAGSLGEPDKAAAEISTALALYRTANHKRGEGLCLAAQGTFNSVKHDEEQAIKLHTDAGNIFRVIGDKPSEGITVMGLGQGYEHLGNYQTALEKYREALRLFQASESFDFASVALFKVARTYRQLGDANQALRTYEECLKLSRTARKTRTEANALNEVALIYASQGNRGRTIAQYRRILSFYTAIGDRRGQAMALDNLGDAYTRFGDNDAALASYKQALPLSEQAGDQGILIATLYNVARAHRDARQLDESLRYLSQSIDLIESLRAKVASPDYRASYFAGELRNYQLQIDVLMQLERQRPGEGFVAQAFLASENARARSLNDLVIGSRADIRPDASPSQLQLERELQGLLRVQAQYEMDLKGKGNSEAESEQVRREIDRLQTEYERLEGELRDRNSPFFTLTKTLLDLPQVQSQLDENTILLEYALGDERSYLWAVSRDSIRSYELPARKAIEAAGIETYKTLTARQEFEGKAAGSYQQEVEESDARFAKEAGQLSAMLLEPIAKDLGSKRLIIVTEGVLQSIPFEALPTPNGDLTGPKSAVPLLAKHEIVMLPSFSTLAAIRRNPRLPGSPNRVLAVLADPVFTASDDRVMNRNEANIARADSKPADVAPALRDFQAVLRNGSSMRLLHSAEEADTIMRTLPRGAGMVAKGFDANRETATSSLLGQYQIVHFATHSFLNSQHPELSGVVLSRVNRDGSDADGFLGLQEIYRLKLSSDLVVLSACDTALGKEVNGEGLVGLTHALISAGSKSVVASLWKVDDRATAALMAEFYEAMLQDGLPPAAALRRAKAKC